MALSRLPFYLPVQVTVASLNADWTHNGVTRASIRFFITFNSAGERIRSSNTHQTSGSCHQFATANHRQLPLHNLHHHRSGWCKRLFRQRSPLMAREADSTPAPRPRHHRRRRYVSSYRLTPARRFSPKTDTNIGVFFTRPAADAHCIDRCRNQQHSGQTC